MLAAGLVGLGPQHASSSSLARAFWRAPLRSGTAADGCVTMTAVDYSTLASTTFGAVLALGGGFLGQWWNERRAIAREERAWQREDRLRTFDDSRRACVDYYEFAEAMKHALLHGTVKSEADLESLKDQMFRLNELDGGLELFTGVQTRVAAGEVTKSVLDLSTDYIGSLADSIADTHEAAGHRFAMVEASGFLDKQAALKTAIRNELGIADVLFS